MKNAQRPVRFALVALAAVCVLMGLVVGIGITRLFQDDVAPLGGRRYSLQTVASRVPGQDGPAVLAGDAVKIEGRLCSAETTAVFTTLGWQAYRADGGEITGTFVTVGVDIEQRRRAGCESHTVAGHNPFINGMPATVVSSEATLTAQGVDVRWRVEGFEVPHDGNGNVTGLRKTFRSELFDVVLVP